MADKLTRCWVVDCKTPDCGVLVLDVIGEPHPYRFPMIPPCEPFEVDCDGCRAAHTYRESDLRWQNVVNLRPDYRPSLAFRQAIELAQRKLSDQKE